MVGIKNTLTYKVGGRRLNRWCKLHCPNFILWIFS